jgi:hypothetical protein
MPLHAMEQPTADVNIHASNRQIWNRHPNKENTKVRPEMTKFKMSTWIFIQTDLTRTGIISNSYNEMFEA